MGEVWDREKRIDAEAGEQYRHAIHAFIARYHHHHLKLTHVRHHPIVGYLFTEAAGEPYNALGYTKNVWIAGCCEIIEDPEVIHAFLQRRAAATGVGDAHPHDQRYRRVLMTTTPEYLRAEGFAEHQRPVIYTTFPPLT
jgi:hypothetical protein